MFYTIYSRFRGKSPTPRKKIRKKNVLRQIEQATHPPKSNLAGKTTFKIAHKKDNPSEEIAFKNFPPKKAISQEEPSSQLLQKKSNPSRGIAFKEVARLEGVEPPTF